ncbi:hypothetical protein LH464_07770 [Neorhizobium sp. T786]|uniref:hypothetical protein n=1 Tax=Pseudorhizobium xiangyangii TaxID=2883104 RepID=UPI001CFFA839|nr:hypothetical protein [Neorhizobium xiangyangii]MCB5202376.1 hypothetical protein [Neorhizobium xiangyangii]
MPKRELIDTGTDKPCMRRDDEGRFKQSVAVGRSLFAACWEARYVAKPGDGDKGDRKHQR